MKTRQNTTRGSTLFVVLFFMALLSIFVGAAFSLTSSTANIGNRSTQMTMAYAVADGTMELVFSRWRSIVSFSTNKNLNARVFIKADSAYNSETKDITSVTLQDLGLPDGYMGLGSATTPVATVSLQTVDATGRVYGSYDSDKRCLDSDTLLVEGSRRTGYDASTNAFYPPPPSGPDYSFRVASANANGFQSLEMNYRVEVSVTVPTRTTPLVATVRRHFTRSVASAAQAAYFYEDRLEIIPGTTTDIKGRVHTNKDLWIGNRSDIDLNFRNSVTFVEGGAPTYNENPFGAGGVPGWKPIASIGFDAGVPRGVPPMNVGGINRESLKPFNPNAAARGEFNPSNNNNSMREIVEPPQPKSSVVVSTNPGVNTNPAVGDYDDYWDTNRNTSADQRAIEEARAYNGSDIKILLGYDSTTGNLVNVVVRGRTTLPAPDGANGDKDSSDTYVRALGILKEALLADKTITTTDFPPLSASVAVKRILGAQRVAIYDRRENDNRTDTIKVTRVDMAQLKKAIDALFFDGGSPRFANYRGQIYISDNTYGDPNSADWNPYYYGTGARTGADPAVTFEETSPGSGIRVKHALMLENGNSLPGSDATSEIDRNFTLATQNAVYVKGDYNTGGNGDPAAGAVPEPPSNSGGSSTVVLSGGNPVPTVSAAILADAITAVSRNFDPTRSDRAINEIRTVGDVVGGSALIVDGVNVLQRGAVSTTLNAAILTGQYQSSAAGYSGGSTNIIRFVENWTRPTDDVGTGDGSYRYGGGSIKQTFTYKGSIMQSFTSKEFNNKFITPSTVPDAYSPPTRTIIFDEQFLFNPPRGFPGTITYTKGPWERPNS